MTANNEKPILYCTTQSTWQGWLVDNVDASSGVRLQLAKKSSTLPGISYDQALEVALCFGWIDGQIGRFDDNFFLQSFTPRRPRSVWSQTNREHVERLTREGRMQLSGLAQVEAAKANGRWDAAYRQGDSPVPDDLQLALDANPSAAAFFLTLNSQNRFAIIFRTNAVKKAETRATKIAGFITMLERGETIHPQQK